MDSIGKRVNVKCTLIHTQRNYLFYLVPSFFFSNWQSKKRGFGFVEISEKMLHALTPLLQSYSSFSLVTVFKKELSDRGINVYTLFLVKTTKKAARIPSKVKLHRYIQSHVRNTHPHGDACNMHASKQHKESGVGAAVVVDSQAVWVGKVVLDAAPTADWTLHRWAKHYLSTRRIYS